MPIIETIIALAEQKRLSVDTAPRQEIDKLTGNTRHQGIALVTTPYPYVTVDEMLYLAHQREEPPLLLLLDLIQDVHNLGSLFRTAEATGIHGVVIQERRAAGITADVVNTSAGAVEHLLVTQVTNLAREITHLKAVDVWIAGLEDMPGAQCYTDVDLTIPLGVVVGSEGEGLRRLVREHCDWILSLPMQGRINSLNAAVAGSIVLYEALRQRTLRSSGMRRA